MSRKKEIRKQIDESEKEIVLLEQKRTRSQSAIMEAYVNQKEPNASDVDYFKIYTNLIALERENLHQLHKELEKLQK